MLGVMFRHAQHFCYMELSHEQNQALQKIWRWIGSKSTEPFVLAGYAGTGKTTLLQHLINQLNDKPLCCAPTGKAASVLQKKLEGALVSTIHRALYAPMMPSMLALTQLQDALVNNPNNAELIKQLEEEKRRLSQLDLKFSAKDHKIQAGSLVIVDEASMVTGKMRDDLQDTGAQILYVGDPGQLPPVKDKGFFDTMQPDAMLEQVQRQAIDNPIVRLSMMIRNYQEPSGNFAWENQTGNCVSMSKGSLEPERWLEYDQVITGKNDTRRQINRFFRTRLNRTSSKFPLAGDRLICLKNGRKNGQYLINGVTGYAFQDAVWNDEYKELYAYVLYESVPMPGILTYSYPFLAHYQKIDDLPWQMRDSLVEFDYAYAITVHKSQGSEWDRVIVADDQMNIGGAEMRQRWLYTAVTRAKKELMWIR